MSSRAKSFTGWVPFHVPRGTPEFAVLWSWLGEERFRDPFFDQTITTAFRSPLHLLLQRATSLEQLVEIAEAAPALEPTGFLFHVSRCGSTLVAQMLARLERAIVISEARPLTSVLEDHRLSADDHIRGFRALVRLYGRGVGGESGYFIKLDARNLLDWRMLVGAYPDVPRVVLHRDPVEVLVSNFGQQQAGLMPGEIGADRLGAPPRALTSPEDYAAFVLARIYETAHEVARLPNTLTVDYADLPEAVFTRIAPHFGLALAEAERAAMQLATAIYSKDASRRAAFTGDTAAKQAEADEQIRTLAAEWLEPAYRKISALSAQ